MLTRSIRKPSFLLALLAVTALTVGCQGSNLGGNNNNTVTDGSTQADASACGEGDDEKLPSGKPKIYHGTLEPEICMSPRQQFAVGALLFDYSGWSNGCTGTLINEDTVLTACHCVTQWGGQTISPSSVRFALGDDADNPDFVFNVSAVWAHPGYQGDADNDVGMLRLSEPITSAGANALPIPVNRNALTSAFVGENVQNCGFGGTEVDDNNTRLYWTVEPVTEVYNGGYQVFGGGAPNGSSVCYGDSGGPGFHLFGGDALAVVGTVSWGDPSCMDYDYFARVDDNLSWIEQNAGALDPCVNLDARGLCDANVANWCDNGQIKSRRCGPCDQVCGWAGDALGYYCVDP